MYNLVETADWVFAVQVDDASYEVVWNRVTRVEDDYVCHFLEVYRDGAKQDYFAFPMTPARGILDAAVAYRVACLKSEYDVDELTLLDDNRVKEIIVSMAQRAWSGEYVGQEHDESLYLQTVAKVVGSSVSSIFLLVHQLIDDEVLGLFGNILVPFEQNEALPSGPDKWA